VRAGRCNALTPVGDNPAGECAAATVQVLAAFSRPGALDHGVCPAEIRGGAVLLGREAVEFHIVDYIVHSLGVAKTVNPAVKLPTSGLKLGLRMAVDVPDEAKTVGDYLPFRLAVPIPSGDLLDRIVGTVECDPYGDQTPMPAISPPLKPRRIEP
jgi:hypothetical protein